MAASFNESQQIDYLWKKLGYGVAKTAGTTGAGAKQAYNESIASPLLYRGDLIWTQSSSIPASPPSNTTDIIQVYKDGGGGGYSPTVECSEDLTSPDNQTWQTNLTNWVPTQFGDNYLIQVYAANIGVTNPQTSGTKLFQSGSGNDDTWFFDYQAGVLNFNGANIPSVITGGVTGKSIYIVGYRYVGIVGLSGGAATGTSISNGSSNVNVVSSGGNVTVGIGGTGNVAVFANTGTYVNGVVSATGNVTGNYILGNVILVNGQSLSPSKVFNGISEANIGVANGNANISINGTSNVAVFANTGAYVTGVVSASGNVTGNYILGNAVLINGVSLSPSKIFNGTSEANIGTANGNANISINGTSNVAVFADTGAYIAGLLSATGNIFGGNVISNGMISALGNIISSSIISALGNVYGANILTGGIVSATGNVTGNNLNAAGLSLSSNVVSALNVTSNIAGGNITTPGLISAAGNITGNYFIGNGSQLTDVNANTLVGNTLSSNVLYSSLTQVGTLSNVSIAGNVVGGNILTGGVVSAAGNVTGGGVVTTGPSGNISGANVVSATTFTATANITGGNLRTTGIISTSGNVYGNAIFSDNYYYANGAPVPPGVVYTASTSPPAVPKVSDQWYDTDNDVLYEFISDGTSTYWVDSNTPAFANGIVSNVAISGSMVPEANVAFDIGASGAYFRNTYTQNLYINSRFSAANMPLGAVVQTVMSSTLGGSVTNSTSYADISYASVTITPSSATNKILILATGTSGFSSLAGYGITADTQLVRSPSISLQIQTVATSGTGGVGATGAVSYSYIDAPATTSTVSYKLQQKISNASSTLTSTNIWLIAMEIAAS